MSLMLTCKDIAARLQMAETYVRDILTKRRDFPPAYRLGTALRWSEDDFDAWLKSRQVKPAARRKRQPSLSAIDSAGSR
jgi:predicted DNA-binding transcriptional regulator AlpA